jgi:hypothetical protein
MNDGAAKLIEHHQTIKTQSKAGARQPMINESKDLLIKAFLI